MQLLRSSEIRFPKFIEFRLNPLLLPLLVAFLWVAGSTHSLTHDHDEHSDELQVECSVCALFSINTAKTPSNNLDFVIPKQNWFQAPQIYQNVIVDNIHITSHFARSPPALSSF